MTGPASTSSATGLSKADFPIVPVLLAAILSMIIIR